MNVLIVGGAKGIGSALAGIIAQKTNFQIIKTSRSYGKLTQRDKHHWEICCDVNNAKSIDALQQQLQHQFNNIDWLINCVGILHSDDFTPEKSLRAVNAIQLITNYHTNAISHLLLIQALEKLFNKKSHALIASLSARIGSIEDNHLGGWYAYRMSKAALNMGLKTLAIEWSRKYPLIKFLLLHPGTTDTDLSAPFQRNIPDRQLQTTSQTAQLLWTQLQKHQNHTSCLPLFLDQKGHTIPW